MLSGNMKLVTLLVILAFAGIKFAATEVTSAKTPGKEQGKKPDGIDIRKLHSRLSTEPKKPIEHKAVISSPGNQKGAENTLDEPEREFLNGRFGGPFGQLGDFFDPSISGGFGSSPGFQQKADPGPLRSHEAGSISGGNGGSAKLHGRHPDPFVANQNDFKQKPDNARPRPLRDDIIPKLKDNRRPPTAEVPKPFPSDAFRKLSSPDQQDFRFLQATVSPTASPKRAVTNKGLPTELEDAFQPGNRAFGFPAELDTRAFGLNFPHEQFLDPSLSPYVDPNRYQLLQRLLLEEQLRNQQPVRGLNRRPEYAPDVFYPQQQFGGVGFPQPGVPLGIPGAQGPRPDSSPDFPPNERFLPRCAQIYDDAYGHFNQTYCLHDPEYPTVLVVQAIARSPRTTHRLFSDVTYQSADDLVDGLSKLDEETYSSAEQFFEQRQSSHSETQERSNYGQDTNYRSNGYICPSHISYARPKRARNARGIWKVIVNLADEQQVPYEFRRYTQTQRLEKCTYPERPCNFVAANYDSRCLQKYNYARMVAFSPNEGLHIDSFQVPVACSCHVGRPRFVSGYSDFQALSGKQKQSD